MLLLGGGCLQPLRPSPTHPSPEYQRTSHDEPRQQQRRRDALWGEDGHQRGRRELRAEGHVQDGDRPIDGSREFHRHQGRAVRHRKVADADRLVEPFLPEEREIQGSPLDLYVQLEEVGRSVILRVRGRGAAGA